MQRKSVLGLSGILILFVALALFSVTRVAMATDVDPVYVAGNPTCSELAPGTTELKVDPPKAGTFSDGTLTVNITNYTGTSFNFTSNIGVDAVFVKAGPGGNLYS